MSAAVADRGALPPLRRPRVLLGLSGSVASVKAEPLVALLADWAEVRVVATSRSLHFFDLSALRAKVAVYVDEDEWRGGRVGAVGYSRGDPVLHIDLRKWADLLVIAPLSANTLAEIAHGLCPNLLVGGPPTLSDPHIPPSDLRSSNPLCLCGALRRV